MHIVIEVILAFLAAAGLLALAWVLFGKMLAPVGAGGVRAVVPASGDGARLEHDVSGLLWLRGAKMADFTIIIADAGLNEAGRAVAETLARREPGITVCPADRLTEYIH